MCILLEIHLYCNVISLFFITGHLDLCIFTACYKPIEATHQIFSIHLTSQHPHGDDTQAPPLVTLPTIGSLLGVDSRQRTRPASIVTGARGIFILKMEKQKHEKGRQLAALKHFVPLCFQSQVVGLF